MFVGITNTPRDYSWGSTTAIAELLGYDPTGSPEAELWLGAHPGSPAVITDPARTGGARTLAEWIERDPVSALGTGAISDTASGDSGEARLPFLMKVLAAASPLSLQAHPTPGQARAGFERENAAGIPLDAPFRNYKDAYPKPELILALSDSFEALCGFRPASLVRADLELLGTTHPAIRALHNRLVDDAALAPTFEWLISRGDGVDQLVTSVIAAVHQQRDAAAIASATADFGDVAGATPLPGSVNAAAGFPAPLVAPQFLTVLDLAEQYPGDPGIVISLLVNRVSLDRGEVLYLPAGNIHAYLSGLGIEVMAASDNVLRGGLTPKHVDVPELLSVLDFTPLPVPYLPAVELASGVAEYRPDVPDFVLLDVEGDDRSVTYTLNGPAIALAIAGAFTISGAATATPTAATSVVAGTDDAGPAATGDATTGETFDDGGIPVAVDGIATINAIFSGELTTDDAFAGDARDSASDVAVAANAITVSRGHAVYITPNESPLTITGSGHLVLATTGH